MHITRIALLAAISTAGLAIGLKVGLAPAAGPAAGVPQAKAFDALAEAAAAHHDAIPDGLATYTHFGATTLAHAPLASITEVSADELAAGAYVMAVFVDGDASGRVPDGAYVVRAQVRPGSDRGTATYVDAAGHDVVTVDAVLRSRDEVNELFPGTYGDPPTTDIPVISSTHVWVRDHWGVDCTGPGWNWAVFYY